MATIHHPDHSSYRHFAKRQRVDKAVQTLLGLLRGITIDGALNAKEIAEVLNWCEDYNELLGRSPLNELKQKLDEILVDGMIDPEEQEDLIWVCRNLAPDGDFYDSITHDIQHLQGIMHGIMADGHVSAEEAKGLQEWLDSHTHLKGTYPYDELDSLLTAILRDGVIDHDEQTLLRSFFNDFVDCSFAGKVRSESQRIKSGLTKKFTLPGICAICPEIAFDGKVFTLTGSSIKGTRKQLVEQIENLGGSFSSNVSSLTQYLVIGSAGNPCWAFSCYGRKVEKAVELRKSGSTIVIVHESDFWDAVEDYK